GLATAGVSAGSAIALSALHHVVQLFTPLLAALVFWVRDRLARRARHAAGTAPAPPPLPSGAARPGGRCEPFVALPTIAPPQPAQGTPRERSHAQAVRRLQRHAAHARELGGWRMRRCRTEDGWTDRGCSRRGSRCWWSRGASRPRAVTASRRERRA